MNANEIFQIANLVAMIGWLLLMVAPKWKWTNQIVISGGISILLGVAYLFYFTMGVGGFDPMDFSTLDGVTALFQKPEAVLIGWLHYLAFDLFVGMWQVRNAQKHSIPHIGVVPCLFFTFMMGPVGLLLYFTVRMVIKRKLVANFS